MFCRPQCIAATRREEGGVPLSLRGEEEQKVPLNDLKKYQLFEVIQFLKLLNRIFRGQFDCPTGKSILMRVTTARAYSPLHLKSRAGTVVL